MLIDTHLHLFDEDYNVESVISRAIDAGVNYLIVSGSVLEDNILNDKFSYLYDNVFISVGFHPEYCLDVKEEDFLFLENLIKNNKKVVAIGEIGLDYHYGKENKEEQMKLFKRQLDLAVKYNLSVVIHTRDAFMDTYNVLKDYNLKGIIHCFSGSLEVAKDFISLGYYLGIGGVVTFSNSKLKDIVKEVGISNIVLETDSPYLSPYRGFKNEPCNVRYICEFIANYLDISVSEVERITTSNAKGLFDLNI